MSIHLWVLKLVALIGLGLNVAVWVWGFLLDGPLVVLNLLPVGYIFLVVGNTALLFIKGRS